MLLDDVALYSTTDQHTADEMTRVLARYVRHGSVVVDATASAAAGNTISLARTFAGVVAIESNRARYELLRHNVRVLGLSTNVKCVYADAVHVLLPSNHNSSATHSTTSTTDHHHHPPLAVQTKNCAANLIRLPATSQAQAQAQARAAVDDLRRCLPWPLDAVFIDPPWGGPRYRQADSLSLTLSRLPLEALLVEMAQRRAARCVALKVPQNFDMDGFLAALDASAAESDGNGGAAPHRARRRYVLAEERDFKSMRMLVLVLEEGGELQSSPRIQK